MPDKCAVYGCSNQTYKEKGISLYRIPFAKTSSSEGRRRRKQWVDFVNRTRKDFVPSGNSAICSEHFTPESFKEGSSCQGKKGGLYEMM